MVSPGIGDRLGGERRRVVRRVECSGAGFARIEQTITRRGSRPLNKEGSYRTANGTVVYPRDGYYYTRNPDGSLTKGQGTYQDGVPCPECTKITPVDPIGIDFNPEDYTVEFDPAVPIDIEADVPVMPAPEVMDPVPDWDLGWMARDSGGCESLEPYFTAEEAAYRNELFLRVWTAAGLMGEEETLKFPELTKEEYDSIRDVLLSGTREDYRLFEREWPSTVKWVKASEVNRDEQCWDPFTAGTPVSYVFCLPTNDPDVTGGDGQARVYGSLVIEIRYQIPELNLSMPGGFAFVLGQKHRFNINDEVVEPCDLWTLLEDEGPQTTDTNNDPDLTGEQGPDVPTPPDAPTDTPPTILELPDCIRVQGEGFIYCPPTSCRIAPTQGPLPVPTPPLVPTYDFRVTDGGMNWALSAETAQYYGATHVWVPEPSYEYRPYGSQDSAAWQPVTDYTILPRYLVQAVVDAFPVINDAALNERRAWWENLLTTAPLADDTVTMMLADLGLVDTTGIGSESIEETATTNTTNGPTATLTPEVCYEARVALDGPFPRWFGNIAGRWIEIEACCPKEDCCTETKAELSEIKTMIASLTEIVLRREAGEQTSVVDLTNIERELSEIRLRLDVQQPATQYDDSRIMQRIAELEAVVRESRTPAYDDTSVRAGIEEIKQLVNARCEKCQPGANYDTRFDELQAMIEILIARPIGGNGDIQVIDTTPYYVDLRQRIDELRTALPGEGTDYMPVLNELRTLIQNLRFATGTEYAENFTRLERLIAEINTGGGTTSGNTTDYSPRLTEIMDRLEIIRQNTTMNYDGQLAMLLSIVQDLQSRTPTNYDDRLATIEALVRNIRTTEATNYESRFDRLETLIASLNRNYPDYTANFTEIKNLIVQLREAGTTNTTNSGSSSGTTTTGTTNCGGTTVNCGGTNDLRLDLILERLAAIKTAPATENTYGDVVGQITRYVDSMKADILRNDDLRYEEIRRRLDDVNALLSQMQSQSQSTTVNTTSGGTTAMAPADPRIEEMLRLLTTLQATTGAMSSTVAALREELSVTQRNQSQMQAAFESYLQDLRTAIRTQGSSATTYDTLQRAEEEYAFQRQSYDAAIRDLQSRLQQTEGTLTQQTTSQTSGGARMVERHERIIYDYPQEAPTAEADECIDNDCP